MRDHCTIVILKKNFFLFSLHLHIQDQDWDKSGTSVGLAVVASVASLMLELPVPQSMVMTGEISPTGDILRVAGIPEKAAAALTEPGVDTMILPSSCAEDVSFLPEWIKERLKFVYCNNVKTALDIVFPGLVIINIIMMIYLLLTTILSR